MLSRVFMIFLEKTLLASPKNTATISIKRDDIPIDVASLDEYGVGQSWGFDSIAEVERGSFDTEFVPQLGFDEATMHLGSTLYEELLDATVV